MNPKDIIRKLIDLNPDYLHSFKYIRDFPRDLDLGSEFIVTESNDVYLSSYKDRSKYITYYDLKYDMFNPGGFRMKLIKGRDQNETKLYPSVWISDNNQCLEDISIENPILPKEYDDIYAILFQEKWNNPKIVDYKIIGQTQLVIKEKL